VSISTQTLSVSDLDKTWKRGRHRDVITRANFGDDRLRSLLVKFPPSSQTSVVVTTLWHYRARV